jgi:signal transduction histidine kinase
MTADDSQRIDTSSMVPPDRYRGPDRRASQTGVPPFPLRLPLAAVVIAAGAAIAGASAAPVIGSTLATTSTVARIILAVAGLAGLLRWRLDRMGRSYWYGFAALAAAMPLLTLTAGARTLDAMTFAVYVVTVPLAWFGIRAPEVDASRRIGMTLAWLLPLGAIGFIVGSIDAPGVHVALLATITAALLALLIRLVVAARTGTTNGRWYAPTLLATAIGPALGLVVGSSVSEYAVGGPGLLVAAGLAFAGAIAELHVAAARHQGLVLAATIARDDEADRRVRQEAEVASQMHEVRSRVAAIEGGVSVLHTGEESDDLTDAVKREIERLRKLVAPAAREDVGPFNVLDSLRPTLVVAASSWPVDFTISEDLMAIGRADDLAQVVHGLIHNATKYAPGSPIEVGAHVDGDHVLITVDDHGSGVPRGERELIFERGWQGSHGGAGFGLGLAIARELMTGADGDLWVSPRPGGGARFTASLPAWAGLSSVDGPTPETADPSKPALTDADRARALRRLGGHGGTP